MVGSRAHKKRSTPTRVPAFYQDQWAAGALRALRLARLLEFANLASREVVIEMVIKLLEIIAYADSEDTDGHPHGCFSFSEFGPARIWRMGAINLAS